MTNQKVGNPSLPMSRSQIHMVVTDLDGTLLSPEKEISQKAVEMINKLSNQNVKFTFITGRPPYAVKRFAQKLDITAPIISCNGAMIVNQENQEIIIGYEMDFLPLRDLLEQAKALKLTVLVLAGEVEYTLTETNWTRRRKEDGRELPLVSLENISKMDCVYKVNIMAEEDEDGFSSLIPQIQELTQDYSIAIYGKTGCEIVAKGINKKTGLEELCKICGVKMEEVLAIGDNENDICMLQAAGIGAAVANATQSTKEAADFICNYEWTAGVMEAISKFVL